MLISDQVNVRIEDAELVSFSFLFPYLSLLFSIFLNFNYSISFSKKKQYDIICDSYNSYKNMVICDGCHKLVTHVMVIITMLYDISKGWYYILYEKITLIYITYDI